MNSVKNKVRVEIATNLSCTVRGNVWDDVCRITNDDVVKPINIILVNRIYSSIISNITNNI